MSHFGAGIDATRRFIPEYTKNVSKAQFADHNRVTRAFADEWDVNPETASQIVNNMGTEFARTVGNQPSRAVGEVGSTISGTAKAGVLGVGTIGGLYTVDRARQGWQEVEANQRKEEQAAALRAILEDDSMTTEEKETMIQRLKEQGVFDPPQDPDGGSAFSIDIPFGGSIDLSPLMLIAALITISVVAKALTDGGA